MAVMIEAGADDGGDRDRNPFHLAGVRAREEMQTIDRLSDSMRLASFRDYLEVAVQSMSTPVPEVLAMVGSNLASALHSLRPSQAWPSLAGRDRKPIPLMQWRIPMFGGRGRRPRGQQSDAYALPYRIGDAIVSDGALADWVQVAVSGPSLEVIIRGESFELSTVAGRARVLLKVQMPATALSACVGRRLDSLVAHPLFVDRDYVVTGVEHVDGSTAIEFDVGQVSVSTR